MNELIDAQRWANWTVDYIKDDSCGACRTDGASPPHADYAAQQSAIDSVDHEIVFTTEGHLVPRATSFSISVPSNQQLGELSVSRLRDLIASAGLQHADCIEKAELRERAMQAAAVLREGERYRGAFGAGACVKR